MHLNEIYTRFDSNSFLVGDIVFSDDNEVVIQSIDSVGRHDSFRWIRKQDIVRVAEQSKYLDMVRSFVACQEQHDNFNPFNLQLAIDHDEVCLIQIIITTIKNRHLILVKSGDDFLIGFVKSFNQSQMVLEKFDNELFDSKNMTLLLTNIDYLQFYTNETVLFERI